MERDTANSSQFSRETHQNTLAKAKTGIGITGDNAKNKIWSLAQTH